ncbi:MAG: hypothetical protein H6621_05800 [Halobacteriovoraceae bacterium]|nr:hypothetical protein [Halobacteriovoraceae bacterium]
MLLKISSVLISLCFIAHPIMATESCSRVAYVNYQEILVDSSSSVRGDGLKFYLNRDPIAREYLKIYQEKSKPSLQSAILSTVGVGMILVGGLSDNDNNGLANKNFLISTGISLIVINYLVSKTMRYHNEYNLQKAVDEYNKRNRPKIFFSPFADNSGNKSSVGINFGYSQDF